MLVYLDRSRERDAYLGKWLFQIVAGIVGGLLAIGSSYAAEPSWKHVKELPFSVRSGIEIARHEKGRTPASLYLICSQNAEPHFILSTRLPGPRWSLEKTRDDNVALFVSSPDQRLRIAMELVSKGRDLTWLEAAVSNEGEGEPDTLVTPPLKTDDLVKVGLWFGDPSPSKVSVVGYAETGVYMAGIVSRATISEFTSSCVPR